MFFHLAEYCDTPQSKERRNREYKVCLNERAILRLLDHEFSKNSDVLKLVGRVPFLCDKLVGLVRDILAMKGEFIKAFHKHRQEHYRGLSEGFLWHSTCQDNTIRQTMFFGWTAKSRNLNPTMSRQNNHRRNN